MSSNIQQLNTVCLMRYRRLLIIC